MAVAGHTGISGATGLTKVVTEIVVAKKLKKIFITNIDGVLVLAIVIFILI